MGEKGWGLRAGHTELQEVAEEEEGGKGPGISRSVDGVFEQGLDAMPREDGRGKQGEER